MRQLLFKKPVDQLLLKEGITIPQNLHDLLLKSIGVSLSKGQKTPIRTLIEGQEYEAILTFVNLSDKYSDRDVIQIRYSEKSPLSQALNNIFSHTAALIAELKANSRDDQEQRPIPETDKEYVEVYAVGPEKIEFKCLVKPHLRQVVEKALNEYLDAKNQPFARHPLGAYFRNDVPAVIYDTGLVNKDIYLVLGSVGQGNWAMVPWIGIFDHSITISATKGIYVVYLLAKDGQSMYLTFNQGCTEIRETHSKAETIAIMRKKANVIVDKIDSRGFNTDSDIFLGTGLTELAELYQKGTIFYKEYKKDNVPPEHELRQDLAKMMQIYQEYARDGKVPKPVPIIDGGEEKLSIKEIVGRIKDYIAAKGFNYEEGMIENFYLSLKSKPFVILAGISGTGKTRLAKLFAEAVGATTANGRYKLVTVRPDWSDSSDLFGHIDLNGRFNPGTILDFVKQASEDKEQPYFLCLDEMNLARVEYYLSDILSIIETRDFAEGEIRSDPLVHGTFYGSDQAALKRYGTIRYPENLYLIGTVNMDETTFAFSRKVLDRANTIEFSYVDLMPLFMEAVPSVAAVPALGNHFLKTEYLLLAQCLKEEAVNEYCSELQSLNRILETANAHVGYRVRDEIVFYLLNNRKTGLLSANEAMDNSITQKILPRIQGNSMAVKNMLCNLFRHCAEDYEAYQTEADDISSKMIRASQQADCKYKRSAAKIAFMVRRFEEDGFTSFWL